MRASVLGNCGRELTAGKFITGLQGRQHYPGGWGPELVFGPGRASGHDKVVVLPLHPVSSMAEEQKLKDEKPETVKQ